MGGLGERVRVEATYVGGGGIDWEFAYFS